MASIGSSCSIEAPEAQAGPAQLVVAVASYNHAGTIGSVAAAVRDALVQDFGAVPARVVLADGGSTDGSVGRARGALASRAVHAVEVPYALLPEDALTMPYHGLPGRARALRGILTTARDLGVRSCVVLNAGVTTVAPAWVTALAVPVLSHDYDYVSPVYLRHPHEGALTKGLVYPLVRALYGARLRQPAASEFACSGRLVERYLDEDLWERDGAETGIDVWLTSTAAAGGFRLCEVPLGRRDYVPSADAGPDLSTIVAQVVGAVFTDLEAQADVWQRIRGSTPMSIVAGSPETLLAAPTVNVERWIESFQLGYRELRDVWSRVLPPRAIMDLRKLAASPVSSFRLDDALWARIVYDFALGYRLRVLPRDHLLGSLTPLYLGWLASFLQEVRDHPVEAADARIEQLAQGFEEQKPYLVSRWRWPETFRT